MTDNVSFKSPESRAFILAFLLRRACFVSIAFGPWISKYQGIQIGTTLMLNIFAIIYQGKAKPLESREDNRIEMFNQYMIQVTSFYMLLFTDFLPVPE